ncbi:MAG: ABC-2 transporter permease [Treponema sp.]|nr:ABC-2 transporter permease [Treponema sp.]
MNKRITLLKKEMSLTALPISYIFIAFGLMAFIPGYPIVLGAFFVCLGIFQTFNSAREAGDIFYTAMLPVEKCDVVKSKYAFVALIEVLAFILMVLITILRMTVLSNAEPYLQNPLMNANLAYLGWNLLVFAFFNMIFLGGFFKTAYKLGVPFLWSGVAVFVVIGLGESLPHFPGLQDLNSTTFASSQLYVLAAGIVVYVGGTFLSMKKSIARFEKIDL